MFIVDDPDCGRITAGFGDLDGRGTSPGPDTAFRIASCTKSFTAALILILRDAGLVELDRPAADYLPALRTWALPCSISTHPTVRMFLTMSSGLGTDNEWADRQESMSVEDFEVLLSGGVQFVSEPGTAYEYSNLGYAILGRIAEQITGSSYVDLVRNRLLTPLGMDRTDFVVPVRATDSATGFVRRPGGWTALVQPSPGAFSAIGGLYSTASDLALWAHWLCSAFDPDRNHGEKILSSASRREMQQMHRHIPMTDGAPCTSLGYGFGLYVNHDPELGMLISHSGGYPGFSSHMRWHPSSGAVAVGLENATYAKVQAPTAQALALAAKRATTATAGETMPWPRTLAARSAVDSLLQAWDEQLVQEWFADNVAADIPWNQRRSELDTLKQRLGTLNFDDIRIDSAATPAQLTWLIPADSGFLRCSILMHPLARPLIQRLDLEFEAGSPTGCA
ncbi:serine hydrolase domain-containing protein [Paenarthrobacter sp. AMU7]|uniref:Serine hydrolase domain-containing protein n=2 Tax=unclassified Paenarthrobacter TaxID=2634190 RepID=A0AB39YUY5_9MICC